MTDGPDATYNPKKTIAHWREISESIILNIERKSEEAGKDWHVNERLIENIVCRDNEVALSAMDPQKELISVALTGELYSVEELETIDARLRQLTGRVAAYDFGQS